MNEPLLPPDPLERAACLGLLGFAAATQVSIAATGILLTITGLLWLAIVVRNRERIELPSMFFPLALYAVLTLVSAAFSLKPEISLIDSKQLVVLLVVPIAYRLLRGRLSLTAVDVVITVGAVSAMLGIIQYVIQGYDNLGRRPQGMLGLNMTYSGLVMLVVCAAFARIMFATHNRTWAALVMPALLIALAFTFTRSAWIGACCGVGLLFVLRDFRLLALLPVALGLFMVLAPPNLSARIYSTFSLTDPSNADRVAMMKSGMRIIRDHPLAGVGPDMIMEVYPEYRDATAVNAISPHLHNVPMQIAAERGLPALDRVAVVHRRAGARPDQTAARRVSVARQWRARRGRGDAHRRHVRVQLRRFRVPDALPRARHAPLRGGADAELGHRTGCQCPPRRLNCRRSSTRRPGGRSWWSAT